MGYRIVKVTTYYKDFLSYYYEKYSDVKKLSYNEQLHHMMKQRFAWSDAYSRAFSKLENEAWEIVANAEPLQKQWCIENGIRTDTPIEEVLTYQLRELEPEIVWFQDSYSFNGNFVQKLKTKIKSLKIVIGNCCSPISPYYFKSFGVFDFVVVCAPFFKKLLESKGIRDCLVVPHAFDHQILDEIEKPINKKNDFLFTGSIILDQYFHRERVELIEELIDDDNIDIRLLINLNNKASKGIYAKQIAYLLSRLFKKTGFNVINEKIKVLNKISKLEHFPQHSKVTSRLYSSIHNPVFGLDMFREVLNSKISFNTHGDIAATFAANMRMYEITGIGSCLLTDWKEDISDYFEDGEEIITYKSLDDAKEKIKWLLNNEETLNRISLKGQQRTLSDHTFLNRAKLIDEKLKSML